MKKTEVVSVLPVAFSGGLKYEGPICETGKVAKWRAHYAPERYSMMFIQMYGRTMLRTLFHCQYSENTCLVTMVTILLFCFIE